MTNSCRKIKARIGRIFLERVSSVEMCLFRGVVTLSDRLLQSNMISLHGSSHSWLQILFHCSWLKTLLRDNDSCFCASVTPWMVKMQVICHGHFLLFKTKPLGFVSGVEWEIVHLERLVCLKGMSHNNEGGIYSKGCIVIRSCGQW